MIASFRARALSGVAAGLTVTALFAASISVPAQAAPQPIPAPPSVKIKLPGGAAASRVVPGRYLVETVAAPVAAGGNRFTTKASNTAATSAVKAAGGKVGASYSELWSGVSVTATDAQIKAIAQAPSVKAIYPVLKVSLPKTTKSATKVSSALDQISALSVSQTGAGIKVGVIDTGIDYDNADLNGGVEGGTFPTARVRFGYDFVGDDYNPDSDSAANWSPRPDADPDDCEGHGTHVAGIIGAGGSGVDDYARGVAPNVTFGAYRVFGCEGSTDTAVILSALNLAKAQGMNVVNLSLGSDFDSWPTYPEAVAVANLAKAGVVVVVAAGNSGDTGLFSIGTPAVGAGIISVASYEGTTIKAKAISVAGVNYAYTAVAGTTLAPADNTSHLNLVAASNVSACTADGALTPVLPGTALLIKRTPQGCDFREKVLNAIDAGAAAAVIYNSDAGLGSFTAASDTGPDLTIPAVSIGGTQGQALAATLPKTMTWTDVQSNLLNPDGGFISAFSSAGLAADLSLVPTISAPGAKIYSTLPVEQGKHGNLSGTSMAAPAVAGSVALLLEAIPSLKGRPAAVAQRLYATATPVMKSTETGVTTRPEAVFRQGSGVVQVANAIAARVVASPSTIKLGEGKSHTVKISLTNQSSVPVTYTASRISGVSAVASTSGGNQLGTTTPLYGFGDVGFKASSKPVTIKAGKTAKIKVKITAPSVLAGRAGLLYGGWVQFKPTGAGNTVSVPFAGLRGDYQAVRLLNGFRYVDEGGMPWALPTLGFVGAQGLGPDYYGQHTYTMDQGTYDVAFVLFHLDYPASDATLKVTNKRTHKSYDAVINWDTYNPDTGKAKKSSTHLGKLPRDAALQYVAMEDAYLSKGRVWRLPNGTYTMTLKVLKPLGKASKKKQWESFTTHSFVINFTG